MKLHECKSIHLNGNAKFLNKEVIISGCFNNQSFIFNHIFRSQKAKNIFHSFENQHFKFINVGFFLNMKSEINKQKI